LTPPLLRRRNDKPVDVARLQQMKTGALLRYGCIAGAILGQSTQKEYQALDDYGRALGEAFQIADDLLDVEGDAAALGKQTVSIGVGLGPLVLPHLQMLP